MKMIFTKRSARSKRSDYTPLFRCLLTAMVGTALVIGMTQTVFAAQKPQTPSLSIKECTLPTRVMLNWGKVSDCKGYILYRSVGNKLSYKKYKTFSSGVTHFADIGLEAMTTYYYRLSAYKGTGKSKVESARSKAKSIRTDNLGTQASVAMTGLLQLPELPTGCESVALTTLLRYHGFSLNKTTIARSYLSLSSSNFVSSFRGSPWEVTGFGVFSPGIRIAANKYLKTQKTKLQAYEINGTSMRELCAYVAAGKPVLVWSTMGLVSPERSSYTCIDQGKTYTWYRKEHCVVLYGYNAMSNQVLVSDPLAGLVRRDADRFAEVYAQMGKMAVIIR